MRLFILSVSILLLFSCSNTELEKELEETKQLLEKSEQSLADLVVEENAYPLVHVVYFKLKPDANKEELIQEINKLEAIEVLHDLEIGTFEDLEDERALSDYQLMMSMAFKNEEDYKTYQAHELHLALKAKVGDYLAGPPATYDYMIE